MVSVVPGCEAGMMRPGSGAPIIPGVMALVGRLAAEDAARNGGLPLLDSFLVKDATICFLKLFYHFGNQIAVFLEFTAY